MTKGPKRAAVSTVVREIGPDPLLWVAQGLVFARIALVLFVFDPTASDAFSLPKSAVGHAFSAALAVCLVGLFLRHGRPFLRWTWMYMPAAAVLLSFVVASVLAMDQTVALFGTWRRYLGLTQLLDDLVLFLAAALAFRSNEDRGRLLAVSLGAAVPVLAYAFVQRAGVDLVKYKEPLNLPISTLGQPDILGSFASIIAITAIAAAIILPAITVRGRAALTVLGIAALFVEFFTGVRAGALGMAAGWGALALVWVLPARVSERRRILGAMGGFGLAVAIALALSPVGHRLAPDALRTDLAIQERLQTWDAAGRLIEARPLLGLGPDNFANGYPAFRSQQTQILIPGQLENSTHSWILYYATSAGLVGLAAIFAFVVAVALAGLRLVRLRDPAALSLVPVAAYLGQGAVGINDLSLDWVLWLAAGVIAGAASTPIPVRAAKRIRVPGTASLAAAGAMVLAVLLTGLLGAVGRIGGSRDLGLAQAYVDANAAPAGLPLARAALDQDRRRPELWANYGAALSGSGADVSAVAAFREAARLDPSYPNHWRNLALVLGRMGNTTGAYAAIQRANAVDPWDPDSLQLLSQLALARGDPQLAAQKGAVAVEVAAGRLEVYDAPVLANLTLSRYDEAERLLRQAFAHGDSPLLRFREAQLFAATGRKELALRDLDLVLAAQPTNADALALKKQLLGQ